MKSYAFTSATYYAHPASQTKGVSGTAPYLTTSYSYDFNTSVLTSLTEPEGTHTFGYDAALRRNQETLPTVSGVAATVRTFAYDVDAYGNDLLAHKESVTYEEADASTKVITSKSWFDGRGLALRRGSGAGANPTSFDAAQTIYDQYGRILKVSNPYAGASDGTGSPSYWTEYTFDSAQRLARTTWADAQYVSVDYSGGSSVVVTDEVGRKRKTVKDGLGRIEKIVEQNPSTGLLDDTNYSTVYTSDVLDNHVTVNQSGQTRTAVFDALRRKTSQTTPEGGTEYFAYTDFNSVLKHTDARGVEKHFEYDSLNRVKKLWYTGTGGNDSGSVRPSLPTGVTAVQDIEYTYLTSGNGNGKPSSVTDYIDGSTPRGETRAYDALGRVTSRTRWIDSSSYTIGYAYNGLNQVSTITYPSGRQVKTSYDTRGRKAGLEQTSSPTAAFLSSAGYDTANHLTGFSLGNGVTEAFTYSGDRQQLTGQTVTSGGNALMSLTYGYSAASGAMGQGTSAGNTGQQVSLSGSLDGVTQNQAFTYDTLKRLVTATQSGVWQRRFAYDRWGNRTGVWDATSGGTQIQSVTLVDGNSDGVPDSNRIATVGSTSYTYDAAGNLTNDTQSYAYDAVGRVSTVGSGAGSYLYDADNRRTKKVTASGTTRYVWDGSHVIAEYDGAGAVQAEYFYFGDRLIARDVSGSRRFYHSDRLSVRLFTDSAGAVTGTQSHLPYGEDAGTTGSDTLKYRFTSYERDTESSTDYAINRQYLAGPSIFNRPDPHPACSRTTHLNRYAYVKGDPIGSTAPLGLYEQPQGPPPPPHIPVNVPPEVLIPLIPPVPPDPSDPDQPPDDYGQCVAWAEERNRNCVGSDHLPGRCRNGGDIVNACRDQYWWDLGRCWGWGGNYPEPRPPGPPKCQGHDFPPPPVLT